MGTPDAVEAGAPSSACPERLVAETPRVVWVWNQQKHPAYPTYSPSWPLSHNFENIHCYRRRVGPTNHLHHLPHHHLLYDEASAAGYLPTAYLPYRSKPTRAVHTLRIGTARLPPPTRPIREQPSTPPRKINEPVGSIDHQSPAAEHFLHHCSRALQTLVVEPWHRPREAMRLTWSYSSTA